LFHAANALLCFLLIERLLRLARPGDDDRLRRLAAAAGALFFSIHPLRVESVAWITERRDVVSGLFVLATVLAYLRMGASPPGSAARRQSYALTLGLFVLSLLCKPTGMTLPLALLILDVYPLRRTATEKRSTILIEKLPFLALMIGAAVLTSITLRHANAFHSIEGYPLAQRLTQPGYRVSFYLFKTLVPLSLSPLYLYRPEIGWPQLAGWIVVAAITTLVLLRRRRAPAAAAAWLAFGALIAPVSGLFQAGLHFAADRYTYLPGLPFAALLGGALLALAPRIPRPALISVAGAVLVALALLSVRQIRVWRDSMTLWDHAIALDPGSYLAFNNRGTARAERGDSEGAMRDYDASIAIRPDWEKPWNNRAIERAKQGDHAGAVEAFTRSLAIQPEQTDAYGYRAISRIKTGDLAGARADLDEALRRRPEAPYYLKRATLRGIAGDLDGVISDCNEALKLKPESPDALTSRGMARLQKRDPAGVRDLEQALRVAPPDWPQRAQFEKILRSLQPR
ncbi:MAG: tetratricopeptide repeat protein, partial [Planctomycetaceae bacterium]|nr:tetratricopeptide repeat protein [Planctomycetaceae bacterium]